MSSSLELLFTPGVEDSIDEGDELVEESKFVKTQVDIVASGSVVEVSSVKSKQEKSSGMMEMGVTSDDVDTDPASGKASVVTVTSCRLLPKQYP